MKIHTLTVERWEDDGTITTLEDRSFDYSGPLALAGNKAARKGEQQVAQSQQQLASSDTANQNAALGQYNTALNTINNPQSSPLYASDYASGLENVANTYGNLRQQAYKMLGATGFGNAPSGQRASMLNTIGNEQAQAGTQAYRDALNQAEQQGTTEAGLSQNQERIYDPNAPLSGASGSYQRLSGMGSTLGDVAKGLTGAALIAAAPFTGGATLMGLPGTFGGGSGGGGGFASLMQPSTDTGGGYNPNYTGADYAANFPTASGSLTTNPFGGSSSPTMPNVNTGNLNTSGFAQLFGQSTPTGNYKPASSTKQAGS